MDVDVHIDRVISILQKKKYSVGLDIEEILKLSADNNRVKIKAIIRFLDDSFLYYYEIVETGKCYPQVLKYSYQYMNGDDQVFRYDDSPHHPDVSTFPHHKHVGRASIEQIVPAHQPKPDMLFEEIRQLIENENM